MPKKRIGKLPARYSFLLNPHSKERLSKCPLCERPTHARKFPLLIHVDDFGPMVFGKTCRYCSRCEFIAAHQHELEAELAHSMSRIAPGVIGNDYLVLGTVDKKVWKQGLAGKSPMMEEMLEHAADFKRYMSLEIEGGLGPAD